MNSSYSMNSGPVTMNQGQITYHERSGVRSFAAPVSGHPRSKPASGSPATMNLSQITHRSRSDVRSFAAPVSGHPGSKPASRHPLQ
jgi:hypothetical protein